MVSAMIKDDSDIAVAHDGERLQPVYALIKTALADNLKQFLSTGERKIDRWYAANNTSHVDFSDVRELFQNINTPEQQQHMQGKS
jgi:molybdopterin-guanine dinucleotide biosynthesis protein A